MKKIAWVVIIAAIAGIARADMALVDFGATNSISPAGAVNGLFFNTWSPGQNIDLVLASDGVTDSGWNLDSTTGAAANDANVLDFVFTPNGAPNPFNDDAVFSDALNLTSAQGTRDIRFFNLNPAQFYEVVIYGARESDDARTTDYTVIGATTANGSLLTTGTGSGTGSSYNNDDTFTVSSIAPTAGGVITIEYSTSSSFGYLTAVSLATVPEPGTLSTMIIGGVALFALRRKK